MALNELVKLSCVHDVLSVGFSLDFHVVNDMALFMKTVLFLFIVKLNLLN